MVHVTLDPPEGDGDRRVYADGRDTGIDILRTKEDWSVVIRSRDGDRLVDRFAVLRNAKACATALVQEAT